MVGKRPLKVLLLRVRFIVIGPFLQWKLSLCTLALCLGSMPFKGAKDHLVIATKGVNVIDIGLGRCLLMKDLRLLKEDQDMTGERIANLDISIGLLVLGLVIQGILGTIGLDLGHLGLGQGHLD